MSGAGWVVQAPGVHDNRRRYRLLDGALEEWSDEDGTNRREAMSEERLEQISVRLGQGIPPTLAEARWLVEQLKQDRDTIQAFTDGVLKMARDVTDQAGQRLQARRDSVT